MCWYFTFLFLSCYFELHVVKILKTYYSHRENFYIVLKYIIKREIFQKPFLSLLIFSEFAEGPNHCISKIIEKLFYLLRKTQRKINYFLIWLRVATARVGGSNTPHIVKL